MGSEDQTQVIRLGHQLHLCYEPSQWPHLCLSEILASGHGGFGVSIQGAMMNFILVLHVES